MRTLGGHAKLTQNLTGLFITMVGGKVRISGRDITTRLLRAEAHAAGMPREDGGDEGNEFIQQATVNRIT